MNAFVLLLATATAAVAVTTGGGSCSMAGAPWVPQGKSPLEPGAAANLYPATTTSGGAFNMSFRIRHGATGGTGVLQPDGKVVLTVMKGNVSLETCVGTMAPSCDNITWSSTGGATAHTTGGCFGDSWCRAWTSGCDSPEPPYGSGFAFLSSLGSNMVLQQAPAKAAVYGITVGNPTAVKVTVTDEDTGTSYTVDADLNATHQPFGPQYIGGEADYASAGAFVGGPHMTWKAFLKPTAAGGNFTIAAACTGCTEDGSFSSVNISNVAFGDVWHCSGQSNMWLPVSSAFAHNDTLANISAGKYHNIRLMAGNSGDCPGEAGACPWMTAVQATVVPPKQGRGPAPVPPLFNFGAACWYFAQKLSDELEAAGKLIPLGVTDTAIGGQRIEEYMVNDSSLLACSQRTGEASPEWNGRLYGKQTLPFVDMTVKGWAWYQGENNMGGTKGSAIHNVGYSCAQRALVAGWRKVWSETPGTTEPMAPFGIVTLASSGSEGGADIGAMRLAQTAGYGVLPGPEGSGMENTFFAQAFDLDDRWGPAEGPCLQNRSPQNPTAWGCCTYSWGLAGKGTYNASTCAGREKLCAPACTSTETRSVMGGIHPRWKRPVGDRLGTAAYNTVYGGTKAYTGPTLSSCSHSGSGKSLTIDFNTSLLRGDEVTVGKFPAPKPGPGLDDSVGLGSGKGEMSSAGSQLYVQVNASLFCVEKRPAVNSTGGLLGYDFCPTWAGGDGSNGDPSIPLDTQWIALNYTKSSPSSITVDLSPLNGTAPTAVQYAWGVVDCCDYSDSKLYIAHGCGLCPLMSTSNLPANPFKAKIVGGKCECVSPQIC